MLSVAGGDDDGDDVQVSFNDKLGAVVRATQVRINRLSPLPAAQGAGARRTPIDGAAPHCLAE